MHLFLTNRIEGKTAWLEGEEAQHCTRVLRFKEGDSLEAIDGKGNFFRGNISKIEKDSVSFRIVETVENWGESGGKISLYISVLHKPDRLEWLFEKAVELGVTEIIPFISEHTVKQGFRANRAEKIMISALKQCKRSRLPRLVDPPLAFHELLREGKEGVAKFILWCEAEKPLSDFNSLLSTSGDIQFLIGPEGDFSPGEVSHAEKHGYIAVSLGPTILRAETAALHMLSVVKHLRC